VDEIRRGYQYVRQSNLMRWFSISSVFFSILWFSLLLPFSRAATAQYPDADALASFLGLFQGVQNGIALLVALLLTNRLFARFGLMNMLLVMPVIYLGGFSWLLAFASFPAIVAFRLLKLVWSQGIAETAWQATFNVVPGKLRDQTYTFFNAVPGQAGVVLSGVILVIGEKALPPQQLYWIGFIAALALSFTLWQARRAYKQALVERCASVRRMSSSARSSLLRDAGRCQRRAGNYRRAGRPSPRGAPTVSRDFGAAGYAPGSGCLAQ